MCSNKSSNGLNKEQQEIAEKTNGLLLVDAGPGTGKTHTLTERYLNMTRKGVDIRNILMLTFTRNSAEEMKNRIAKRLKSYYSQPNIPESGKAVEMMKSLTDIKASTFDSYCSRIVLGSPDAVAEFFGFKGISLSRGAKVVDNDTLNKEHFRMFYSSFIKEKGKRYVKDGIDLPAVMADIIDNLYELIQKLMSAGIIPLADDEWFADGENRIFGNSDLLFDRLINLNSGDTLSKTLNEQMGKMPLPDFIQKQPISEELIHQVAYEDRKYLIYFIHDVYFEYIKKSIIDNRLTFALTAIFAFAVLYQDKQSRDQNSVTHMMIDEFQDTNELQLMISMMLVKEGNLCVVGDWKQGIYGFRFVSIDNIKFFEKRLIGLRKRLNSPDQKRVQFDLTEGVTSIALRENYRSSSTILDAAFRTLSAPATNNELVSVDGIIELEAKKDEIYGDDNGFAAYTSESVEKSYSDIANMILSYVNNETYIFDKESGERRRVQYGDIAVLFRTTRGCSELYDTLISMGIPAFLQGDVEIMSTKAGKLILAWLRFVNDKKDTRGLSTILTHEGFSLSQIKKMEQDARESGSSMLDVIPHYLVDERNFLIRKKRRPNDMITSILAFHGIGEANSEGMVNEREADEAQAIVNIISSSYSGSLITIPDIIRLMEDDIEKETKYSVDSVLDRGAVTIQTMHKSKGLEYPVVIVAGINQSSMPSTNGDKSKLIYDENYGVRLGKTYLSIPDTSGNDTCSVVNSWKFTLMKKAISKEYDEERRLFFVAASRAMQYMIFSSGPKPSPFMKHFNPKQYSSENFDVSNHERKLNYSPAPEIPEYKRRRMSVSVHDIMNYVPDEFDDSEHDDRGKDYGNLVHEMAEQIAKGLPHADLPEAEEIIKIIDSAKDASVFTEYKCSLPVGDITLRGIIDMLAIYPEYLEIHDYKTDRNERNIDEYRLQLSVYAQSVMAATKMPVKAYIDYVSMGKSVEIEIISMLEISEKVNNYLNSFDNNVNVRRSRIL